MDTVLCFLVVILTMMISPPGPLRRQIVMRYCELTDREVEYVALSRDTTESDLKQRREILSGTAHYLDQAAVQAAIHGAPSHV